MATLLLIVLTAGLASQWLAWRLKLPAIVILIAAGLLLGPVTGVITPSPSPRELNSLIGLGVAIILFEGGMYLKLRELRDTWGGVGTLVLHEGLQRYGSMQRALQYYNGALNDPKARYTRKVMALKKRLMLIAGRDRSSAEQAS